MHTATESETLSELARNFYFARARVVQDTAVGQRRTCLVLASSIAAVALGAFLAVLTIILRESTSAIFLLTMLAMIFLILGAVGIRATVSQRVYVKLMRTTDLISVMGNFALAVAALVLSALAVILASSSHATGFSEAEVVAGAIVQLVAVAVAWAGTDNSRSLLRSDAGRGPSRFARYPALVLWLTTSILFVMFVVIVSWLDLDAPIATGLVLVFGAPIFLGFSAHRRDVRIRLIDLAVVLGELQATALANTSPRPARASRAALISALSRVQTELFVGAQRKLFGLKVGRLADIHIAHVFDLVASHIGSLPELAAKPSSAESELWNKWLERHPREADVVAKLADFAGELRSRSLAVLAYY